MYFTDSSAYLNTVKDFGGTNIVNDAESTKLGDGALYFDGSSGYLIIDESSEWRIFENNEDNWTIDFWVKHTNLHLNERYISIIKNPGNQWFIRHTIGKGITFKLFYNFSKKIDMSGGEITDSNWHHIAMCKVGSELGIYKDGTQVSYAKFQNSADFSLKFIGIFKKFCK